MDTLQTLKTQIGELVWNNIVLSGQIEQLTQERDALKKQLEEKNDRSN